MKPAPFSYVRPHSVADALAALAASDGTGKVIAGGQSLMPMINFRMVRPSVLVDINRISGLDVIEDLGAKIRIGATVRHRFVASNAQIAEQIPVLHEAMKHVAHLTVRNRGTFCGSICHADPAAEMPMIALLLNGQVEIASPRGNRCVAVRDFLVSALTTTLEGDELVTAVKLEKMQPGAGWGFEEFARRHGDYALAAVSVVLQRHAGSMRNVRVALMGVADTAIRVPEVESLLEGQGFDQAILEDATSRLRSVLEPNSDLNGSADYRRHLAGALFGRALGSAWARTSAKEEQ